MCSFRVLNTCNEVNVYRWQSPLFTGFVFINSYWTCFLLAFGKLESSCFSSLTASWLESHSSFVTKQSDISQKNGMYFNHSGHSHLSWPSHSVFAIPTSGSGLDLGSHTTSRTLAFLALNQETKMSLFVTLGLSCSLLTRCTFFRKTLFFFNDHECKDNDLL